MEQVPLSLRSFTPKKKRFLDLFPPRLIKITHILYHKNRQSNYEHLSELNFSLQYRTIIRIENAIIISICKKGHKIYVPNDQTSSLLCISCKIKEKMIKMKYLISYSNALYLTPHKLTFCRNVRVQQF